MKNRVIMSGRYCGPYKPFLGARALLLEVNGGRLREMGHRGYCRAQFDNIQLRDGQGTLVGFNWHQLPLDDFDDFNYTT